MKSYYEHMKLPQPVLPSLQHLALLKGQTALVTGANSGIGRAIALALGQAGANVVVNYVAKPEDAEAVATEIRAAGSGAMIAKADVSDESQVQAMFAAAVQQFGTVDILASNAGLEKNAPFHEMSLAQWDAVMNVNLRGAFLCAREAVREFLRRGVRPEVSVSAGKIIFTSSVHEVIPWAGHVNYAASKGGLMLLMKSLAQEVAEKRIRVNSIGPGAIRGLCRADEAGALQAHRRGRRDRPRRGLAGLGLQRLHRRHHAVHRRRHDAVPGLRDGGLNPVPR
jgi:glucose 1-dehydrogenase